MTKVITVSNIIVSINQSHLVISGSLIRRLCLSQARGILEYSREFVTHTDFCRTLCEPRRPLTWDEYDTVRKCCRGTGTSAELVLPSLYQFQQTIGSQLIRRKPAQPSYAALLTCPRFGSIRKYES